MNRLVLLVEGDGDVQAVPSLVGRLLTQLPDELQGQLFLDNAPMKIGGVHQITGKRQGDLARHLGNAAKRPKLGAALLILDGDAERVEGQPFCAVEVARVISQRARLAGAGTVFSFAVVFLRQEYESLLLAVADQQGEIVPFDMREQHLLAGFGEGGRQIDQLGDPVLQAAMTAPVSRSAA